MNDGGQVKNIDDAKPFALELDAMRSAHAILQKLEPTARSRVLTWLQSAAFDGEPRSTGIFFDSLHHRPTR